MGFFWDVHQHWIGYPRKHFFWRMLMMLDANARKKMAGKPRESYSPSVQIPCLNRSGVVEKVG
jgi:hypothetical protein